MGRGVYLRSCFIGELEVLEKNSLQYLGDGEERIVSLRSFSYIASSRTA